MLTNDNPTKEDIARLHKSIGGTPDEIKRDVDLMAANSRLKVIPPEQEQPKPPPPYDSSEAALKKWVGKTCVRIHPGIYVGAKYLVRDLQWSEKEQVFMIFRDSPELEYSMNAREFCRTMVEYKPEKPKPEVKAETPKTKTPWSDDGNAANKTRK